jgi:esterase/lipase
VVGLRLPGHGTAPSGLLDVTAADWQAAVRLAARDLRRKIGPDRPLFLVGYSNGAALAVDYTLAVLEGADLPRVDSLVLLSAAIEVSPAAALATYLAGLSRLTGLEKLDWTTIQPEFDPYKYNSFTVNAGAQIHTLTADIARRLDRLSRGGALAAFPRVLAFQSAVDATIPAGAVVDGLLGRLPPGDHELVLFDVDRNTEAEPLLRADPETPSGRLLGNAGNPFVLDLVTNTEGDAAVLLRRRPAGAGAPRIRLCRWPGRAVCSRCPMWPSRSRPTTRSMAGRKRSRHRGGFRGRALSSSARSPCSASWGCSRFRTASSSGCASTRSSPTWTSACGTSWRGQRAAAASPRRAGRRGYSAVAGSRDRKALKEGQMSSRRSIRTDWKLSSSIRRNRSSIELS